MSVAFRQAVAADLSFIIEGIVSSEKSGTETLAYCKIFDISESEFTTLLTHILEEEIEGQEWFIPSFCIAELDGFPVACLSAWVEGRAGSPSGILKAQAMSYFLGDRWVSAQANLHEVASIQILRITGALQLENIYTASIHRGKGIAGKLIEYAIKHNLETMPEIPLAEIQLMGNNENALQSYTKCGFLKHAVSAISNDNILHLLPGNFRVSLTRTL